MDKTILYVGLNDKKARVQLIETTRALNLIESVCFEYTNGATISTGRGIYKNGKNRVIENTIIIELLDCNIKSVYRICRILKKRLNQQEIAIQQYIVDGALL